MNATGEQPRAILQRIARRVMIERGLLPDFSAEAMTELGRIRPRRRRTAVRFATSGTFSGLPSTTTTLATWTSLPLPRRCPGTSSKILVAVADVESVVKKRFGN